MGYCELGIAPNPQTQIPNPQSTIPNNFNKKAFKKK